MRLDRAIEIGLAVPHSPDVRPAWLRELDRDPTSVYYRALFAWVAEHGRAVKALEIGTYQGFSTAHLAAGYLGSHVVTVDCDATKSAGAAELLHPRVPNIQFLVGDSASQEVFDCAGRLAPYDVLFIDAEHSFRSAYREYMLYRPLVTDGGLILFDDVGLNVEMEKFWSSIADPKARVDVLHYTGFGMCVKDPSVTPRSWEDL